MMERFTSAYVLLESGKCVDAIELLRVWRDRLAAYEDTGLEPEEITTEPYGCVFYCNRKCNLDGDFCSEGPGCPYEIGAEAAKHLLDLAKAEKDGRLVVMPVKEGTKIYRLVLGRNIFLTRDEAEAEMKKREEADNAKD